MTRSSTLVESLLAAMKRNFSSPELTGIVSYDKISSCMLEALLEAYIDPCLVCHHRSRIAPDIIETSLWLSEQDNAVVGLIDPDEPLHCKPLNHYEFMIKRSCKPPLTLNDAKKYQALQTIVCTTKYFNSIFFPMVRTIKSRIMASKRTNVIFNTDASVSELSSAISNVFPPRMITATDQFLEVDFSKYDKSQELLALLFEIKLLSYFGMDDEFIDLWWNMHIKTRVKDRSTSLSFDVFFQRKSGDPATWLGNTMYTAALLAYAFPVKQAKISMFSGDDSLIIGPGLSSSIFLDPTVFAQAFNLEAKVFFHYKYPYFCSKFLIPVNDLSWCLVPDPIKLCVKLGTRSLKNYIHAEQVEISMVDNLVFTTLDEISPTISEEVSERYPSTYNTTSLYDALIDIVSSPANFHSLFTLPDAPISADPSLPKDIF